MIAGLSVLGLITARGGSKGLPGKNLRKLGGRTLIARTVDAARGATCLDRLILSSDDAEIIAAAIAVGCEVPFIRPEHLSCDEARSIDVVRHALDTLPERYDLMVLLQPTSPLRTAEDIDGTVRLCVEAGAPSCVSVCPPDKPPQWTYAMDARGALRAVVPAQEGEARRQDLPSAYAINGAVYAARVPWLLEHESFVGPGTLGYVMPKARSIDIDDELDLVIAEAVEDWQREAAAQADSEREGVRLVKGLLNQV